MDKELTYGVKALLVLMVFCQHFIFAANQGLYSDVIPEFTLIFRGDVAVGCLFIISGYVLMKSWGSKDVNFLRELCHRGARLIIPMIGAYVVLYLISIIGAGSWGQMLPRMGYDWGYILSFGTSNQTTVNDLVASFINQLIGYNDQQILVAWILRHEIFMSVLLLVSISLFNQPKQKKYVSLIMVALIVWTLYKGVAYGLYAAFGLGVLLAQYEDKLSAISPKKVLFAIVVVTLAAYAVIEMDLLWDNHWKVEQINKGRAWLIMLMTDDRYFVFSLVLPYFLLITRLFARSDLAKVVMNWAGCRSYSLYLMGQFAMQLSVWGMFSLNSIKGTGYYLPPLALFLVSLSLALMMGELFYRVVERPAMSLMSKKSPPKADDVILGV